MLSDFLDWGGAFLVYVMVPTLLIIVLYTPGRFMASAADRVSSWQKLWSGQIALILGTVIVSLGVLIGYLETLQSPSSYAGLTYVMLLPLMIMTVPGMVAGVGLALALCCWLLSFRVDLRRAKQYLQTAQAIALIICVAAAYGAYSLITSPPPSE